MWGSVILPNLPTRLPVFLLKLPNLPSSDLSGVGSFCQLQILGNLLGQESRRTKVSRIFVPNSAPNFAPNFPRIFRGLFALRFVGDGDQKKFTKNPRHLSMQNSQANTKKKKKTHEILLESRQSKNLSGNKKPRGISEKFGGALRATSRSCPELLRPCVCVEMMLICRPVTSRIKCSKCYDRKVKITFRTSKCCNR